MKKTPQKRTPKKRVKKTRKLKSDPAQKRPVFAEFTNSWGFRGRKWWDAEARWSSKKNEHGKFLHPLLESIIKELQRDYQCSVLRFLGPPYPIREVDVSNKELWRMHQIHQKKRNGEPLSQDEQRDLKVWLQMLSESLKRIEQLGEIVAGAVACGDTALLEHLILIMQSLSKPTSKAAKPKAVVVEQAYDKIVLRRLIEQLQKENPGLKGLAASLAVVRRHAELLKKIRLPSASDVDKEITEIPAFKKLVPKWSLPLPDKAKKTKHGAETIFERNRRQIQRVCQQTGRELSKG